MVKEKLYGIVAEEVVYEILKKKYGNKDRAFTMRRLARIKSRVIAAFRMSPRMRPAVVALVIHA